MVRIPYLPRLGGGGSSEGRDVLGQLCSGAGAAPVLNEIRDGTGANRASLRCQLEAELIKTIWMGGRLARGAGTDGGGIGVGSGARSRSRRRRVGLSRTPPGTEQPEADNERPQPPIAQGRG